MTEPRDPRELLSMLNARCQHFAMAPGGIPVLTPQDVAAALGTIGRTSLDGEYVTSSLDADGLALYARLKYVGEDNLAEETALALRRRVVLDRKNAKWKIPRPYFVADLCRLAIVESVDPHLCSWCGGTSHALVDNRKIVCDGCKGTGHRWMRDVDRAAAMKCTKTAWAHSWRTRYLDILGIVERWESMLEGGLGRKLRASSSSTFSRGVGVKKA